MKPEGIEVCPSTLADIRTDIENMYVATQQLATTTEGTARDVQNDVGQQHYQQHFTKNLVENKTLVVNTGLDNELVAEEAADCADLRFGGGGRPHSILGLHALHLALGGAVRCW